MSKNQPVNYKYSSYFRIFLGEWRVLGESLQFHLQPLGQGDLNTDDMPQLGLMDEAQIHDALNGPFAYFYQQHIDAYMLIKRLNFELRTRKESAFSNAKKNTPPPGMMADRDVDHDVNRPTPPQPLLDSLTSSDLDAKLKQLDKQFSSHLKQCKQLHTAAYNEAIRALNNIGLDVNEFEKKSLFDDEPYSEIQRRFQELNVAQPASSADKGLYFARYFWLKLFLCIHSILSRQQQPHAEKDIGKVMKSLKALLADCRKYENDINNTQQSALNKLVSKLEYE